MRIKLNKYSFLTIVGAVLPTASYAQTFYQCLPLICKAGEYRKGNSCEKCPTGRYSPSEGATSCLECGKGTYSAVAGASSCTTCPAGYFSTTTGLATPSGCKQCDPEYYSVKDGTKCGADWTEYKSFTSGTNASVTLSAGWYKIEVAGAGGGGAGGVTTKPANESFHGGKGGNGALNTKVIYLSSSTTVKYTVGSGGGASGSNGYCYWDSSNDSKYGGNGGTSTFIYLNTTIKATGGDGAQSAHCFTKNGNHDNGNHGGNGSNAGNGNGGSGGNGNTGSGNNGSNGWVKIYSATSNCYNNNNCTKSSTTPYTPPTNPGSCG